jgi:phosphocarrier protein
MTERSVTVKNNDGIHCRPSGEIVAAAGNFPDCSIRITTDKGDSDLASIISLIVLGLSQGDNVTVIADGPGEEEACEKIAGLFEYHFDFPHDAENA